jgi:hypothetical protein
MLMNSACIMVGITGTPVMQLWLFPQLKLMLLCDAHSRQCKYSISSGMFRFQL